MLRKSDNTYNGKAYNMFLWIRKVYKSFLKINILLRTFIIAEALVFLVFTGYAIIKPQKTLHLSPNDFFVDGEDGITADDSSLRFRNTDGEISAKQIKLKNHHSFSWGAYDITAKYASRVSQQKSLYDVPVNITISAGNTTIYADSVALDDSNTQVKRTFWIPIFSDADEFNVTLEYNETGELDLFGIDITERVSYRFVQIAFLVLIFLLIDIIIYFFSITDARKREKTSLFFIFGVTVLISSLPFLSDYLVQGHDMQFHIVRIAAIAAELEKGTFPVRMMSEMCNGYGYANSLYYCDFFLYIPAFLHNLSLPLQTCYKIYAVSISIITVLISYYSFKRIVKDVKIGALGAVLYTLSAYRLNNLHVRSAVGEYTAMAFLPLVILGIYYIYISDSPKFKDWLPLSLGMSAIIMSHILSVEMIAIFLVLFCIFYIKRTLNVSRIMAILKAGGLTLALTAWFFVPFLQSYTQMETRVTNLDTRWIQAWGINVLQLLGFYPHGDMYVLGGDAKLLLTVGISVLTGLAIIFYCLYKHSEWKNSDKNLFYTICPTAVLGILAMTLALRYFPWTYIQKFFINVFGDNLGKAVAGLIGSLQFPWRFLSIATALLTVGTVVALAALKKHLPTSNKVASVILAVAIVFGTVGFYVDFSKTNPNWHFYTMSNHDSAAVMNGEYYLANTDASVIGSSIPSIISGNVEITRYENDDGIVIDCCNMGESEAMIDIPVFAYDNYHAYGENGNELAISKNPENNRIVILLPAGYSGTIFVKYVSPIFWRVCEFISAVTMAVLIFVSLKKLFELCKVARACVAIDSDSGDMTSNDSIVSQRIDAEKDEENE